jgi:hypothetical protein
MRDRLPSSAPRQTTAFKDAPRKDLLHRVLGMFEGNLPVPVEKAGSGLPQFPGVDFVSDGIDLDGEAEENGAAIRAGLVYFKHNWPGQAATVTGSEAFRLKVWKIVEEVGVPLKGPRPGWGTVAIHQPVSRKGGGL